MVKAAPPKPSTSKTFSSLEVGIGWGGIFKVPERSFRRDRQAKKLWDGLDDPDDHPTITISD